MKQAVPSEGDNVRLAVFSVIFAVFALSLGDALIKLISTGFQLWQLFVMRSLITVPVLFAIIKIREPNVSLVPIKIGWTALRSLMLALMWVIYYAALPKVELSVAAAVYYTLPLFITLFAAIFVGEKVGALGWLAMAIGFGGVLLILRPQADDFNAFALLPLASAILFAFSMILTRTKCRDESPLILSLSLNVTFIGVGVLATLLIALWSPTGAQVEANTFLFGGWTAMGAREWIAIFLLATSIIIGSIFAAIAYQSGPSSMVAAFDFSYLAFAALWGLLFFAEVPDAITATGIILIAIAGIVAVRK